MSEQNEASGGAGSLPPPARTTQASGRAGSVAPPARTVQASGRAGSVAPPARTVRGNGSRVSGAASGGMSEARSLKDSTASGQRVFQ